MNNDMYPQGRCNGYGVHCDGCDACRTPATGTTASAAGTIDRWDVLPTNDRDVYEELREDGGWVKHADHLAALAALAEEARREALGGNAGPYKDAELNELVRQNEELRAQLAAAQGTAGGDAVAAMERAKKLPVWDSIDHRLQVELDTIFKALAAQPVAEAAAQAASAHESELLMNDRHYRDKRIAEIAAAQADDNLDATTYGYPYAMRAELAHAFLKPYMDANGEKLLDYEVQPIIRRLAAAILEWQSLDKVPTDAAPTAQPTLDEIRQSLTHPDAWHGAVTPKAAQPTPPDDERARMIESMCMTWRHDFGLDRRPGDAISSGMSEGQRDSLRRQMGQLYDHHFVPAVAALRQPGALPDEAGLQIAITALQSAQQHLGPYREDCWSYDQITWDHYQKGIEAINAALAAKQAGKEA